METLPADLQGVSGKGNISGPAIWNAGNSWRRFVFQVDVGEYRHQDGLLCREGRSFCSTGFARCGLQGGISLRLIMGDRIQSENDVNGVPVVGGHLVSG